MGNWIIKDDKAADWALEKIREHRATIAAATKKRDDLLTEYKRRCDDLYTAETEDAERGIAALTESLKEYADLNLPPGKKTLKLPFGKLKFSYEFLTPDEKKAAADNPELVKYFKEKFPEYYNCETKTVTIEKANWKDFKKDLTCDEDGDWVLESTGELVKGLRINRKFDVETDDKGGVENVD